MFEYEIVYIKGNPNSGTPFLHEQIDKTIVDLIKNYNYKIISSDEKSIKSINTLPSARVYIGFSRGSRYLKKLSKNTLKISIGGIKGPGVHQFIHDEDKILLGDISKESLDAHFLILEKHLNQIQILIDNFLKKQ